VKYKRKGELLKVYLLREQVLKIFTFMFDNSFTRFLITRVRNKIRLLFSSPEKENGNFTLSIFLFGIVVKIEGNYFTKAIYLTCKDCGTLIEYYEKLVTPKLMPIMCTL